MEIYEKCDQCWAEINPEKRIYDFNYAVVDIGNGYRREFVLCPGCTSKFIEFIEKMLKKS